MAFGENVNTGPTSKNQKMFFNISLPNWRRTRNNLMIFNKDEIAPCYYNSEAKQALLLPHNFSTVLNIWKKFIRYNVMTYCSKSDKGPNRNSLSLPIQCKAVQVLSMTAQSRLEVPGTKSK